MKEQGILPEKLVVMHLGSGSSVSAILNGKAMDNSMGYTPLEGLAMSTRVGTIDAAAALNLKKALKITSDEEFLLYLNKKCGLLGLSGISDDMRDVIQARDEGDLRASLAHSLFIVFKATSAKWPLLLAAWMPWSLPAQLANAPKKSAVSSRKRWAILASTSMRIRT